MLSRRNKEDYDVTGSYDKNRVKKRKKEKEKGKRKRKKEKKSKNVRPSPLGEKLKSRRFRQDPPLQGDNPRKVPKNPKFFPQGP